MRKALILILGLMMVVSGVAAVSAYEAHLINVTAHVENALTVDTTALDFGTVFPQEQFDKKRIIELSTSALAELNDAAGGALNQVKYQVYGEWKPAPSGVTPTPSVVGSDTKIYYPWMWFLKVAIDATPTATIGTPTVTAPGAQALFPVGTLKSGNTSDELSIRLDVPVFASFYNALTDPKPSPVIIPTSEPGYNPNGMDYGIDLKIQVIDITRSAPTK